MRNRTLRLLACFGLVVFWLPLPLRAEGATPETTVQTLHDALIDTMKEAGDLGYEGRYERMSRVLANTFDLDFMARKSVGRHWRELGDEEQKRWLTTFERYTAANYAGRFDGYSGQHFETLGEEPAAHETVVVRTRLVQPSDEDVELNYRLRKTDSGWRIIDVYLNGTVSELALRRSEYSSAIKRDGFDALLTSVDGKITDLAAGKSSGAASQ